jgi:hypothetical protein
MVDPVILAECQSLECRFLKSIKQCLDGHPRCFNRASVVVGLWIEGSKACSLDWRMRRKGLYGIY